MSQLGLILLGTAALLYLHSMKHVPGSQVQKFSTNTQFELDPRRWRHDGSQPVLTRNGNGAPSMDHEAHRVLNSSAFNAAIGEHYSF